MGLLSKIVINAAYLASDTILDAIGKQEAKSKEKLFEQKPGTEMLVIGKKIHAWVDKYYIYDKNKKVKYNVKGKFTLIMRHLFVYNAKGKELGTVIEKRHPLAMDAMNHIDFDIEMGGKKLGEVRSSGWLGKYKMSFLY